jgi:hypothetical protein
MLRIKSSTNAENFIKIEGQFCTTWLTTLLLNIQRRSFSCFFVLHFVRSKTEEVGSSVCYRANNSLKNPIYSYTHEFHFS